MPAFRVASALSIAPALVLVGLLGGCHSAPVSRLSPDERAVVAEIASEIERAVPADGTKASIARTSEYVAPSDAGLLRCRLYEPIDRGGEDLVVMVHGGAWIAGSIDYHDGMARAIASSSGAPVLSVEYTLAPMAMFPQQLAEVRSAIAWAVRSAPGGVRARRLALCGDSAGGNMVAVIAREWGTAQPPIALVALVNPVVDLTLSKVTDPETLGFSNLILKAYVPVGTDPADARLSPLLHPVPAGHPATFIAIGADDPWRAEQESYAGMLEAAGVRVEVFHAETGHLGPSGAHATPAAMPTLRAAGDAIKAAFARP